jgi:hypothetical protein
VCCLLLVLLLHSHPGFRSGQQCELLRLACGALQPGLMASQRQSRLSGWWTATGAATTSCQLAIERAAGCLQHLHIVGMMQAVRLQAMLTESFTGLHKCHG